MGDLENVHLSFVRKDFIRQRVQRRGGRHNPEMESGEKMKILAPCDNRAEWGDEMEAGSSHCRRSCGCLIS